jgi:cold-inducible RNA-binding protein
LSYDVTRDELIEAFGAAGKVLDAKVPTDRETGRPRGFAFVEFENDEGAARSIELLNGKDLKGRPLRVNEADARPPRPPGGGPPSFRPGGGGGFRRDGPPSFRNNGGYSRGGGEAMYPAPDFREDRREGRRFKQKPQKSQRAVQKPATKKPIPKKTRGSGGNWDDYDDYE